MKREDGYYWIRFREGPWQPAEWCDQYDVWLCIGGNGIHTDREWVEVGERIVNHPPTSREACVNKSWID